MNKVASQVVSVGKNVANQQLIARQDMVNTFVDNITPENLGVLVRSVWGKVPADIHLGFGKKGVTLPIRKIITPPVLEFLIYQTLDQQKTGLQHVQNIVDKGYQKLIDVTDTTPAKAKSIAHGTANKTKKTAKKNSANLANNMNLNYGNGNITTSSSGHTVVHHNQHG